METFGLIVSVCSGCLTVVGFIGIFVKYGRDKGTTDTTISTLAKRIGEIPDKGSFAEMRKDIDGNAKDINALGSKVNQIQLDNMQVITALSSDLGWIKSSLTDIKQEMQKKKE